MKKIFVITSLFILAMAVVPTAEAGLSISPARQEIWMASGESKTIEYTVKNTAKKPVTVVVYYDDWSKLPENEAIDAKDWLHLETRKILLGTDEEKKIKVTIVTPENAIGELVAMVTFEPRAEQMPMVSASYGSTVYLVVKGTERKQAEIGDIKVLRTAKNTIFAAVKVKNTGNIHIRPRIRLILEDKYGIEKYMDMPYGKPVYGKKEFIYTKEVSGKFLEEGAYSLKVIANCANGYIFSKEKKITLTSEAESANAQK